MADLQQGSIGFPWQLFMESQQMKNQNQRTMFKDIEGMGAGAGQIGLDIEQYKKKQKDEATMKQLLAALQGQGSQPAPMPMPAGPGGGIPGGPTQNMSPQAPQVPMSPMAGSVPQQSQAPDWGKVSGLAMQLDPSNVTPIIQSMMKMEGKSQGMNPYQQSSVDLRRQSMLQHQQEFNQTMKFKEMLSDLLNSKNSKEMKFKIQKYQGDNLIKNLFGWGPTEQSVGTGGGGAEDPELE